MNFCTNCGASLGLGRFCTNCGTQVAPAVEPTVDQAPHAGADATVGPRAPEESPAEQTVVRMPAVQPDSSTGSRYPLFADELPTHAGERADAQGFGVIPPWTPPEPSAPVAAAAAPGAAGGAPPPEEPPGRDRGSRAGWIVSAVLLLLLCAVSVAWLMGRDGDDVADASGSDTSQGTDDGGSGSDDSGQGSGTDEAPPPPEGQPEDLAGSATASGPSPVPPSTDFAGNRMSYPPANMLDDDPESAYRIEGDASGTSVTLDLPEEATIHEVGLVNGYAKSDTSSDGKQIDWYAKNRRILEVEWIFDDGTTVSQTLKETTDLQTISVDGAVTESIELRLTEVSPPGKGKLSKDVTAISSVLLRGSAS